MDALTLLAISCIILMIVMAFAAFGRRDNRPQQHHEVVMPDQYVPNSYTSEYQPHASNRPNHHYQPWHNPYGPQPYQPYPYPQRQRPRPSSWFSFVALLCVTAFVMGIFSQNITMLPHKENVEASPDYQPIPQSDKQREIYDPFVPRHQ